MFIKTGQKYLHVQTISQQNLQATEKEIVYVQNSRKNVVDLSETEVLRMYIYNVGETKRAEKTTS